MQLTCIGHMYPLYLLNWVPLGPPLFVCDISLYSIVCSLCVTVRRLPVWDVKWNTFYEDITVLSRGSRHTYKSRGTLKFHSFYLLYINCISIWYSTSFPSGRPISPSSLTGQPQGLHQCSLVGIYDIMDPHTRPSSPDQVHNVCWLSRHHISLGTEIHR